MADLPVNRADCDNLGPGGGAAPVASSLRMRTISAGMAAFAAAACLWLPAAAQSRMVVADETIVRRTCPSVECGGVGRFNLGKSVLNYEAKGGWTRVSPYYTAACHDGQSAFVQMGSSDCTRTASNKEIRGMGQGRVSEG